VNKTGKTYDEWVEVIEREFDYIDVKPYSHNIIGLALSAIAKEWGNEAANRIIGEMGLDALGWSKVTK